MLSARREGRSGRRRGGSTTQLFTDLLTAAVKTFPDNIAVRFENRELTYQQLDDQATQLARELIGRGIGPGDTVAIAITRSIESVLAVWAVSRTGATFVPVDPMYPADRIEFMLADSQATLGLTTSAHRGGLGNTATWLELDEPSVQAQIAAQPTHAFWYGDRVRPLTANHPAYLIYTSGSTGRPKAVVVTHDGFARVAAADYGITSDSRVTHLSSPSFDFSILEFLHTFPKGATLVIVPPTTFGGEELAALVTRERVTHLTITPGALESVPLADYPDLRTVICAGEALPAGLVQRWTTPDRPVFNAYGPTETTVIVTTGPMALDTPITLGRITDGSHPLILDPGLRIVPIGVAGELYIAGSGLAQGYLGRPELTADRFIANPYASELGRTGARMYRTGDLVRRTPDGDLEYLGRTDFQVKIRGLRIELGEIDAALTNHPDIAFAVTLGKELPSGATALVAYVLPHPSAVVTPAELADFLGTSLPAYMVPSAITVLDELPLTPVGKLDRAALPEPVFATREFRAPSTETEKLVAEIFAAVLHPDDDDAEPVGADDNFFDLGGNSLLATQVSARLSAAVGTRVPLHLLFEAPSVADLATALAAHTGATDTEATLPLAPMPRPDRIPLSYAQQRMWFLNRFNPDSVVNNIPMAVRLTGPLDLTAMRAAVTDLIARHEVLRTIYPSLDGEGSQLILDVDDPRAVPRFAVDDTDADRVRADVIETLATPFDVTTAPPLRIRVLRLSENEHVLVCVVHHIAGDGWSMRPLTTDLMTAYLARANGTAPAWAPLPVQYADFSLWQRGVLGAEDDPTSPIAAQADFWRTTLAELPDELTLPFDLPRPHTPTFAGAKTAFTISAELRDQLNDVARDHNGSLFMVLHAALAVLLAGMSGTDDIAIGTPVAGRGDAALDDLIGMFVNTAVLRTRVDPNATLGELLATTRDNDIQAFAHTDIPFERLVELLAPERSTRRNPLFQVMLSFQNMPSGSLELPSLRVSGVEFDQATEKFDLSLTISESQDPADTVGLYAQFSYATDLFNEETVAAFVDRFQVVLESIVANQQQRIREIDLLSPAERADVLETWNRTTHPVPDVVGVLDLIQAQVRSRPDAVALLADTGSGTVQQLTYAEFSAGVNRLARKLIEGGVGPETRVAIGIRRSVDTLVAVHAVLAAGGAYVPIDLDHPVARIGHILDTARPAHLLMTSDEPLELPVTARRIDIDTLELSHLSSEPVTDAERLGSLRSENTAYVIFTSGSTGRPKGVAVSHSALLNQLSWLVDEVNLDASDIVLHKTPVTFDPSVRELFAPLMVGARTVIATHDGHRDPQYLSAAIERFGVTVTAFVPSLLAVFVTAATARACRSLRVIFVGGEALPPTLVDAVGRVSDAAVVNSYGPTEFTITATLARAARTAGDSVPIGRPVWNARAYVLDAALRPAPVGVRGELYLAGAQLARGYHARPDLTADRFVADPFGPPHARMYRTGDLVRWSTAGELEFLGRTDFQVKLRGQRIELGEIETALIDHPAVWRATVQIVEAAATQHLVAYVIPTPGSSIDPAELTRHAAQRLPSYMVPTAVVALDEFPLNPSGKLDRRALPQPVFKTREFRAPVTPTEVLVAATFAELLGADRVGLDDDFFAIGGNSLLAARAAARIGAAIDASIPVREFFEAPTVAELAERLANRGGTANRPKLVAGPRPELVPLSQAQQRMWTLNQLNPESPAYNIPLALRLTGNLDVNALREAVVDVLERHESLRTSYPTDATGLPYQQLHSAADALPGGLVVRSSVDPLAEAVALMSTGFDVTQQVPVRAALFTGAANGEYLVVLVIHHITGDGASVAPLARDLMTAYYARSTGEAPAWAPLSVQYADYALWQQAVLGDEADETSLVAKQLAFWRGTLAGLSAQPGLPQDRPYPAMPSARGATTSLSLSADVHQSLDQLARDHNASLFQVVHAALAVLVGRLSGRTDVAIGTPVAGRGERALDDLVGMFVNTLTLRTEVPGSASFAELLKQVSEADLAALENADVPFERVVDEVAPNRVREQNPLFQVLLAFENIEAASFELPGLTIVGVDGGATSAKFDLSVGVSPIVNADRTLGEITIGFNYATDIFDASTVETLAEQFSRVLTAVAADPTAVVGDIDLVDADARAELLRVGTGSALEIESGATLVSLFEAQAQQTPTAVAVTFDGISLPYGAFAARVNRLARHLISIGVRPESRVALGMRRSLDLLIGIYAINAAGAAYVPLDPDHPADRIAHVLDTANPVCVLTTSVDATAVADHRFPLIDVNSLELSRYSAAPVTDADRLAPLRPDNTAYVIFTSGSTGRPKGVAVSHASAVNQIRWITSEYSINAHDVVLFKTPATFDVSVWELFSALSTGARLVIADADGHRDPRYLADIIAAEQVTITSFVPSMLSAFAADVDASVLTSLRALLIAGEALTAPTVTAIRRTSGAELHNLYGPTEATVHATSAPVAASVSGAVPIGRPVFNTQTFVLDSRLRPVPSGVVGELYLAGTQLARGYLDRPDLTADRFLANPFAPGERMYRTGDLVRWTRAGELEYLGRSDFQVKVRGLRIELGEIEAALTEHDGVAQAVVVVRDDLGDQIVAYLVPATDELSVDDVRANAARLLPNYMVPAAFVVLDAIPVNANGKLDRAALPEPAGVTREYRAPVTETEQTIASVFADLLDVERVGRDDSLFDLGGNSLIAARAAARLSDAFGEKVPMVLLFTASTPGELAAELDNRRTGQSELSSPFDVLLPLRTSGSAEPLFCVHPFGGIAWSFAGLAAHVDDRPIYGLQSPALAGDDIALPTSVEDWARIYVKAIRSVQPSGPYHLIGWSLGGVLAHAMAVQLQREGEQVALLSMMDSYLETAMARATEPSGDAAIPLNELLGGLLGDRADEVQLDDQSDISTIAAQLANLPEPFGSLGAERIGRFMQANIEMNALTSSYSPATPYDGDVVYFSATQADGATTLGVHTWENVVTGTVHDYPVPASHWRMSDGAALAVIAAELKKHMSMP
ncbi:non-ribosomal peptide synthetase [Nocardia camponoti]|uniref:Carrier domain-containing protein n=1 Tax=Nocardia camponoti TaxID=1616106 RepID=A0A917V8R5_9NOCA|nr:non-ribosomal peptide synthetase [Nocardia camponoti]GGK49698.1 hypothetical protein GCM10011591_21480 [Nocardia camponoti]